METEHTHILKCLLQEADVLEHKVLHEIINCHGSSKLLNKIIAEKRLAENVLLKYT